MLNIAIYGNFDMIGHFFVIYSHIWTYRNIRLFGRKSRDGRIKARYERQKDRSAAFYRPVILDLGAHWRAGVVLSAAELQCTAHRHGLGHGAVHFVQKRVIPGLCLEKDQAFDISRVDLPDLLFFVP